MLNKKTEKNLNAPEAAPTAKGAGIASVTANATGKTYSRPGSGRKRHIVRADGPTGPINIMGQDARTLEALVHRGASGVTALEVSSWAFRLGAYVHDLRHGHGLAIETIREDHEGGWHARYVLRSPVTILEVLS